MKYDLKIIIGGVEITEDGGYDKPSICGVQKKNSTSLSAMGIGATAADSLYFTIINPHKNTLDGEKVEFFIREAEDTTPDKMGKIAERVGTQKAYEAIDANYSDLYEEEGEPGEPLTPEEIAEAEAERIANVTAVYNFFNGEPMEIVEEEPEESPEWIRSGVFYVTNTIESEDGSIRVTAYDGMALLGEEYNPACLVDGEASAQDIYNDFREQTLANCGVQVDEFTFEAPYNVVMKWDGVNTYRDTIGLFAGLVGGYATFGDDDTLGINLYADSGKIVLTSDLITYKATSAGELTIDGASCDRARTYAVKDVITAGTGEGLSYRNPYVNEGILNDVYNEYRGLSYVGASVYLLWDETIQSGTFMRIMSDDEYENFLMLQNAIAEETNPDTLVDIKEQSNFVGKVILVSNQTIDFTGNATSYIDSIGSSVMGGLVEYDTGTAQKRKLVAEYIEAVLLQADRIFARDITATGTITGATLIGAVLRGEEIHIEGTKKQAYSFTDGEEVLSGTSIENWYDPEDGPTIEITSWYLDGHGDYTPMVFKINSNGAYFSDSFTANEVHASNLQNGTVGPVQIPANGTKTVDITFENTFPAKPTVVACFSATGGGSSAGAFGSTSIEVLTDTITTEGCTIKCFNAGSSARAPYVSWFAISN